MLEKEVAERLALAGTFLMIAGFSAVSRFGISALVASFFGMGIAIYGIIHTHILT